MNNLLKNIRSELKKNTDKKTQQISQRFFKEKIKCYGVKTALVTKIAKQYWQEIKHWPKKKIFELCENLFSSGYCEEAFVVSSWCPKLVDQCVPSDLSVFEKWINTYIDNWAKCDSFCNHTMGDFIEKYPEQIALMRQWAQSKNRWLRRAAAVSLIIPAKRGKYLTDICTIADLLLEDSDDMVQKGYGWLLKEASRLHQQEIFAYVQRNKQHMPRTALRYAIELMPQQLKKKAMEKN